MSESHLSPCSTCARHVRVSDRVCPFCGTALSEAFRAQPAPRPPARRLNRAALYALGASSLAIAACSDGTSIPVYGAPAIDAGHDAEADAQSLIDAAYGGPPLDGGADVDSSTGALYGGPPVDAGHDAEADAEPLVDAAYGGPPVDSGTD